MNVIRVDNEALSFTQGFSDSDSTLIGVHYWYLEIGEDKLAKKEIGFNLNDEPIVCFPNDKNRFGFFGDSPVLFEIKEWQTVDALEFMSVWRRINE
ncbi:MAG: hypothetical protein ACI8VL_001576 [Bacteroidia bacterium]|jgi:hypothetical protein